MALNPDTLKILYRKLNPLASTSLNATRNAASDLSRLSQYVSKVAKETPYGSTLPLPVKNALQAPHHGSDWAWVFGGPRYTEPPRGPLANLARSLLPNDSTGGILRDSLDSAQFDFNNAVDSMSRAGNYIDKPSIEQFKKYLGF